MIPGEGLKNIVKKIAADQIIMAPTVVTSFFVGITLLEGNGMDVIKRKFANDFIPAMKMNYTIWPAAQTITFSVVPYNLRVPWVSCVALVKIFFFLLFFLFTIFFIFFFTFFF